MELTDFLHAGTNSCKSKVDWKFLGWDSQKWGDRFLKLTVSEEWTDGRTDFLHIGSDSKKLKADQIFFWVGMV